MSSIVKSFSLLLFCGPDEENILDLNDESSQDIKISRRVVKIVFLKKLQFWYRSVEGR